MAASPQVRDGAGQEVKLAVVQTDPIGIGQNAGAKFHNDAFPWFAHIELQGELISVGE